MNIEPSVAVGPFRLNMTRDQIAELSRRLGVEPFRGSRGSSPYDYFQDMGIFCYYDAGNLLEAVELAEPARAEFDGKDLLSLNFGEAIAFLKEADSRLSVRDDGATSFEFGVGIWAPIAKDEVEAPVESVIVFRKGYYDDIF